MGHPWGFLLKKVEVSDFVVVVEVYGLMEIRVASKLSTDVASSAGRSVL